MITRRQQHEDRGRTGVDGRRTAVRAGMARHPFLFVVLEGARPLAGGARYRLADVAEIVVKRGSERRVAREPLSGGGIRLVLWLPGRFVSGEHLRIRATQAGWLLEDLGSTNGTYINGLPTPRGIVGPGDLVEVGWAFLVIDELAVTDAVLEGADVDLFGSEKDDAAVRTIIPFIAADLELLRALIQSRTSLALVGEPGTGKELLARAIHRGSERAGPLVAVNCAALTQELIESELFGHVRGAFSGAVAANLGYVRAANNGTLLLDEIVSASPAVQAALLRVLQESEVTPVGSARPVPVDVRFLATTQVALNDVVAAGRFRADLRDRLQGYVFRLPPLRERILDLGVFIAHSLREHGADETTAPTIAPDAALKLLRYGWPGNMRQLDMVLTSARALAPDGVITEPQLRGIEGSNGTVANPMEERERSLVETLRAVGGNVSEAAKRLGKPRASVHRWMKRFNIDPSTFRRQ